MADTEKQLPVTQTLCGSLRRDGHWKCLTLTLMIVVCIGTIFWCHFDKTEKAILTYLDIAFSSSERTGPCKEGYIYIPVACVVMLYLVYLVECWHSHAWLELKYKSDIGSVYNTISKMQEALPVIWWKATCYHYIRRTRQVMRYRNGDAFTSTQVYYERVDSSTAGAAFNFTRCGVKDISRPLSDLEKYPAIKIKISKGFSFSNLDAEYEFEEQRSQFFQEHETKDDYMEGREGMDLINVDFKEYVIAFKDPNNLPWYVSHAVFWMASLILLSWPLRAIIEFKTAHLHYHIHKLFGSNYLGSDHCPGLISRVSTMNSTEFEMSIRNNNVIIPSYSEAMLVDIYEQQLRRDYGAIKPYPSKFPRSLTNATLAGRTSWRSATPAVVMNQVKKFKSCNVLESVEPPLSSGSFRCSVRQLTREGSRTQVHQTISLSPCNITGFLNVENVRLTANSTDTPAVVTSSTDCIHPIEPSVPDTALSDGAVSCTEARSRLQEGPYKNIDVQNVRSTLLSKQPPTQLSRSLSVPASNPDVMLVLNHTSSTTEERSPVASVSNMADDHPVLKPHPSSPHSECYNTNSILYPGTISTSAVPSTPSSPPGYDDAIKMRQITPSLPCKPAFDSFDIASTNGLTETSSALSLPSIMSVTGARACLDEKGNTNLVLVAKTIDSGINTDKCVQSLGRSRDNSTTSSEEEMCLSNLHSSRLQQLLSGKLKPLPKVSKITEAEDSDIGCLHGAYSDSGDLENASSVGDCLSNRHTQVQTSGKESISRLTASPTTQDGRNDPLTSLNQRLNRSTQSPSVSATSVLHARTSRVHTSPRHRMETSV